MNEFDSIVPIELDNLDGSIPYDYVLVEYDPNLTKTTSGGIIFVSETYADEAGNINRMGTVVIPPKHLFFYRPNNTTEQKENGPRLQRSMRWQTSVEIMKGDQVWFDHMEAINAYRYTYQGRHFKTIKYDSIIAAKRGDEVIMCNGNILLEEIEESTEFQGFSKKRTIQGKGKVAYIGSRNNAYNAPIGQSGNTINYREDLHCDIPVGSTVDIFKENWAHVRYLEGENQERFEGRKKLLIVKRYMIALVNEKAVDDHILVEPFEAKSETGSGLTIVDSAKKRPPKGIIKSVGDRVGQVGVGETVIYGKKAGTDVAIDGVELLVIKASEVLAIV